MKKNVTLTIDSHLWELSKNKLDCSRSEFFEEQLKKAIGLADDEETLLRKKIVEHQNEINVLESKLCKIREQKMKKSEEELDISNINEILQRIKQNIGIIGENQLKHISKANNIPLPIIIDLATKMDIEIRKNFEVPHEGNMKTGIKL